MMSHPEAPYDVETMHGREHHDESLPVRIVNPDIYQRSDAARHASWSSYVLAGTEAPFRLLAFDAKRSRALVTFSPAPTAPGGTTQYVRLAKYEQVSGVTGALYAATGTTVEYKGQPDVWVIPQSVNGAVLISILEERNTE